ncbi:uncharacterized protein [Henckelia pumila]|uniref:uncharacterized protein n=1 Tax=Henckelia pumila TaxID=405737 RepID=UPI003C6DBDA6
MANSPSLMSSTVNVANFVSVRPWLKDRDRSNYDYAIWREQMLCLLDSQGLLRFIDDGRQPSVPEQSPEEQEIWRRTDRLIKGWILGSLGNDAVAAVAGLNSSREVWLELQNIFNQVLQDNNNVQIQIQNQIPDSSTSKRVEDQGEAAAAGGIRNAPVELELASQTPNHVPQQNNIGARKNYTKYLALRRAITRADWVEAGRLLDTDEGARTTIISEIDETALLLAVAVGKTSNDFVRGLIGSMPVDTLAIQNSYGNTVLHRAAMIGNKEIADLLLARNPELLYIQNKQDYLPVHIAAIFCHKSMLERLIDIHEKHAEDRPSVGQISIHERNIDKSPFIGQLGASLLSGTIISQFIDVALYLVRKYPELATLKNQFGIDALFELARSGSVFGSGAKFCWWRKLIYSGRSSFMF